MQPDILVQSVSHELNTALTTVLGNAHILRAKGDSMDAASRARALGDLEEHAERLFSAIQNLLMLARVEMGEEPYLEPVVLSRLLNDLVATSRREGGQITLRALDAIQPVAIDRNLFKVVLRNVLENARVYSPAGSNVEVMAQEEAGHACVYILDHGPGVAENERELIFEPFYRSPSIIDTIPGLGLGLPVARRLMELHGGTISVSQRESGGAAFTISLPTLKDAA